MKNQEIIDLEKSLKEIKGYSNPKFNYIVAKNLSLLKIEVETFSKMEEEIVTITKEYDEAILETLKEYSKKDEFGKPKMIGGQNGSSRTYDLGEEGIKQASIKFSELTEKYSEQINQKKAAWEKYLKFLSQENTSFIPVKISKSILDETNPKTEDYLTLFTIISE